jgi:DNA excision repair protein ERCC-3
VNRPTYIHEYILTKFSLYAAVSVGLTQNDILNRLKYFAKNEEIPPDVKSEIELYCRQYGKAKLVLKQNKYYIEPNDRYTRSQLMEINSVKMANQRAEEENIKVEEERKKNMAHDEHMQNLSADKRILYQRIMNDIKHGTSTTAKTAASSNIMG